jgi:hypothetical protein
VIFFLTFFRRATSLAPLTTNDENVGNNIADIEFVNVGEDFEDKELVEASVDPATSPAQLNDIFEDVANSNNIVETELVKDSVDPAQLLHNLAKPLRMWPIPEPIPTILLKQN